MLTQAEIERLWILPSKKVIEVRFLFSSAVEFTDDQAIRVVKTLIKQGDEEEIVTIYVVRRMFHG